YRPFPIPQYVLKLALIGFWFPFRLSFCCPVAFATSQQSYLRQVFLRLLLLFRLPLFLQLLLPVVLQALPQQIVVNLVVNLLMISSYVFLLAFFICVLGDTLAFNVLGDEISS